MKLKLLYLQPVTGINQRLNYIYIYSAIHVQSFFQLAHHKSICYYVTQTTNIGSPIKSISY